MTGRQMARATPKEMLIEINGKLENLATRMEQQDRERAEIKAAMDEHSKKSESFRETVEKRTRFLEDDYNQRKGMTSGWTKVLSVIAVLIALISAIAKH